MASAAGGKKSYLSRSRPDPTTFMRDVLGLRPSAKQLEYGLDIVTDDQERIHQSVLRHKRTLVKSCNAGGKTWDLGAIALWALERGFRVLITASTLAQADAGVGAEVKRFRDNALPGTGGEWSPKELRGGYSDLHELRTFSVSIGTEEEIAGSAAGRHYERMCLIIDEANTVNAKLLEQVDRICVSPHDIVLAAMNATPPSCAMRRISEVGDLWNIVTISGYNHPNVVYNDPDIIPGAITRQMIDDQLKKAGGNRKHFFFAPPVLGEYADSSSDGLIQEVWLKRSNERWLLNARVSDYRGTALGLDVAGTGNDASSMWGVRDRRIFRPMLTEEACRLLRAKDEKFDAKPGAAWMRGRGTQASVDMVKGALHSCPDVRAVAIDASGLGNGPVEQLQREQKKLPTYTRFVNDPKRIQVMQVRHPDIVGYTFGASPEAIPSKHKFKKFKDQLLWTFAEALRNDQIDIPPREFLFADGASDCDPWEELTRPVFGVDGAGHLIVADKASAEAADEDMRKRVAGMPSASPNELHGMALAWWQYLKLPPGPRPIQDTRELRAVEMERLTKKAAKEHLSKPTRRRRGALPWHTR